MGRHRVPISTHLVYSLLISAHLVVRRDHHRSGCRRHDEASGWGRDTSKAARGRRVDGTGIVTAKGTAPVVVGGRGLRRGERSIVGVWS